MEGARAFASAAGWSSLRRGGRRLSPANSPARDGAPQRSMAWPPVAVPRGGQPGAPGLPALLPASFHVPSFETARIGSSAAEPPAPAHCRSRVENNPFPSRPQAPRHDFPPNTRKPRVRRSLSPAASRRHVLPRKKPQVSYRFISTSSWVRELYLCQNSIRRMKKRKPSTGDQCHQGRDDDARKRRNVTDTLAALCITLHTRLPTAMLHSFPVPPSR